MEDLVVFIEEKEYQKIKQEMNKKDDWFTLEDLKTLEKIVKNF